VGYGEVGYGFSSLIDRDSTSSVVHSSSGHALYCYPRARALVTTKP
jgi:hypothetical protein